MRDNPDHVQKLAFNLDLALMEILVLREFSYECIKELDYVQSAEDISQCASAKGAALVEHGIKLLGVKDLSRETLREMTARPVLDDDCGYIGGRAEE